jgi:hypothetical protein
MKKRMAIISIMLVLLLLAVPMSTMVQARPALKNDKNVVSNLLGGIKKRFVICVVLMDDFVITDVKADETNPTSHQTDYSGNVELQGLIGPDCEAYAFSFLGAFIAGYLVKLGINPEFLPGMYTLSQGTFRIYADKLSLSHIDEPPAGAVKTQVILGMRAKLSQ